MILERNQGISNKVINALGQSVKSSNVKALISVFPEKPIIYDKPILHDDSDKIYYEFRRSGVLLGFSFDLLHKLEFVYFYILAKENFQACSFEILQNISKETTKKEILDRFGLPGDQRSNKKLSKEAQFGELIIGRSGDWLLYDKSTYCLRFEFNDETNKLEEINFMLKGTVPGYDLEE